MKYRRAESKEEATHRYPTDVRWGKGYFDDGFRYVVANSVFEVLEHTIQFLELRHIQVKNGDKWEFAK